MVETECPDVVGHLDKIKMQNVNGKFFKEEEKWYQEAVIKTLKTIAEKGVIVEVNTRGVYKKATADLFVFDGPACIFKVLAFARSLKSQIQHTK